MEYTYVHTGGVSSAYSRICMAVQSHTYGDGSKGVVFIGSQPAWTKQPKWGVAYRKTEGNGLLLERVRSKRGPVHREGSGVPQNGGNSLLLHRLRSKQDPVH